MDTHNSRIAGELQIRTNQVAAVADLLEDGATIPFMARYRKEVTGQLDEVQITAIRDGLQSLAELDKRRATMLKSLQERDLLTTELERQLNHAYGLTQLEDLYLPYKQKRRTRAEMAREKGLESLAKAIFKQKNRVTLEQWVKADTDVNTVEEALAGARDIIAEWVSEDAEVRARLRNVFAGKGKITARVIKKNEDQGAKYRNYFNWEEPVTKAAGHRILAILRGEQEKILQVSIRPVEEHCLQLLERRFVRKATFEGQQVSLAVEDSYKRLLGPSLENELRAILKSQADKEAIDVFSDNLRQLLLASPLGQKSVMALDPGFRTGAKLVCLDRQGKLLHHSTIYPTLSPRQRQEAGKEVVSLCRQFQVEAIAIGNGTAGRETEQFVRDLDLKGHILITMVDESGASIYSASETARKEFPDQDVTVRGSISIGRRLQDPLAELIKIDPKSIGVGQYQHDVDQKALRRSLDDVVMSCVNSVGVEVNTASTELLSVVSGLGPALAANILTWREENGPFSSRAQLKKVKRLGSKAFEQCAGFLRISDSKNPLDWSGVHPERYQLVGTMAADCGCSVTELMTSEVHRKKLNLQEYVNEDVGLPTLKDIMDELAKPGRDPRQGFVAFAFVEGINEIKDLEIGMRLPGLVTNVTKFGAFVDVGVHQDGLVHISQLADRYVKDPAEVVSVRQQVMVRVLEVDIPRKRIALTLRDV